MRRPINRWGVGAEMAPRRVVVSFPTALLRLGASVGARTMRTSSPSYEYKNSKTTCRLRLPPSYWAYRRLGLRSIGVFFS